MCFACASPQSRPSETMPPPAPQIDRENDPAVLEARRRVMQQHLGEITEEHDEFTRREMIRLRYRITPDVGLMFVGLSTLPGSMAVRFTVFAPTWRYLRCHTVDALVDGEPLTMPEFQHDGETVHGGVTESVIGHFGDGDIETMARARSVRFRVCRDVYELDQQQLRSLRTMLDRFRAMTSPPVEAADAAVAAPMDAAQESAPPPDVSPPGRRHHHGR